MTRKSYPMRLTPLVDVRPRRDKHGKPYLMFRAKTASDQNVAERTVRVFGPNVAVMADHLAKGVTVSGRVSHDDFKGADGRMSQTLRLLSLDA